MKLSKTKDGFMKNPVKRDSDTCKVYDAYINSMEGKDRQYKKNLSRTGDMYKEK